ncbi:MAG: UDP-glucuronate 4-epimerase [Acidimicrobiaceae bacterium]|nr:UDP-glucuronate 4-epimerase [Acidimicrobiaceae bacterium]
MVWVVTGAAGFVGSHLVHRLVRDGIETVGIDNLNEYYSPAFKRARLADLDGEAAFRFQELDLRDLQSTVRLCREVRPEVIVHLAAQPGIRFALDHPAPYVEDNVVGFLSVLEAARAVEVPHLVYASSSSVYGSTSRLPFSVHNPADHPVSLYAATKRANELMAHSYSDLFGIPSTGLRFFTVYGPWGRPDMAYFLFAQAILDGRPITVNGDGEALRDLTYVDDIIEGVVRVARHPPAPDAGWSPADPDPATSRAPWRLYNIGHGEKLTVNRLVALLEQLLGRTAVRIRGPEIPGDVPITHADVADLEEVIGFRPTWNAEDGLAQFVRWLLAYRAGAAPETGEALGAAGTRG